MTRALAFLGALGLVMAACSAPTPTDLVPGSMATPRAAANDRDGDFVPTLSAEHGSVPADEPIDVEATLTYIGVEPTVEVWGSGSGLVGFDVREIGGSFRVEALHTDDCARYELALDEPLLIPFEKSGGWDPSDPGSAEVGEFLQDPVFRLRAGAWEIVGHAAFFLGECGFPQAELSASVVIVTE